MFDRRYLFLVFMYLFMWLVLTVSSLLCHMPLIAPSLSSSFSSFFFLPLSSSPSASSPLPPPHVQPPSRAIEKLTGHQFDDYSFNVSYIMDMDAAPPVQAPRTRRGGRSSRDQGPPQPGPSGGFGTPRPRQHDFPLRMLVPTQFVGAIIGKEGLTIKNVTKQTQSK